MKIFYNPIEQEDIAYIHSKASTSFKKLAGSTLLITGGSGFLSYYISKSIAAWNEKNKAKIKLIVYSRFQKGLPQWLKDIRSSHIIIKKKDITKVKFSKENTFHYIIHAASIASPIIYRQYPIETMHANVKGFENILEYAVQKKKIIKGILYFSSSEIYGDPTPEHIPTPETYNGNVSCTGPRACYDESKRYCETLSVNYAQVHNLPTRVARPFNNYGPGLSISDGRVVPDFAKNILSGKDIVMFSNGSPRRTFCYVADAIVGYLKILTHGKNGEAYNIGVESPEISIHDLAQKMVNISKDELGYTGKIISKKSHDQEYLTDNPQRRCPIIKKAQKDLDYDPEMSLEKGLSRSLLWYKSMLSMQSSNV